MQDFLWNGADNTQFLTIMNLLLVHSFFKTIINLSTVIRFLPLNILTKFGVFQVCCWIVILVILASLVDHTLSYNVGQRSASPAKQHRVITCSTISSHPEFEILIGNSLQKGLIGFQLLCFQMKPK